MSGVPRNGTSSTTQVSSARSPGGAGWIANEQDHAILAKANELWLVQGGRDTVADRENACRSATQFVMGVEFVQQTCTESLVDPVAEAKRKQDVHEANIAYYKRVEEDKKLAAATTQSEFLRISKEIENGNRSAADGCERDTSGRSRDQKSSKECYEIAQAAFERALRSKKIAPESCGQWVIANTTKTEAHPNAMQVSLSSTNQFGSFEGRVKQMDGRTLVIFDESLRLNVFLSLNSKTKIFQPDFITVGNKTKGYGVQTGSKQITLASGAGGTAANIDVQCIDRSIF